MIIAADWQSECRICGTSPTVVIVGHQEPDTELCGICFWHDREMIDPAEWPNVFEPTGD